MTERVTTDAETRVQDIRAMVERFVSERDWHQFHAPKNISMALAIEAAELMEHFQWISVKESRDMADDDARKSAVAEELADVLCYGFALANEMGIDVATAMREKMKKNEVKYPAERFQGKYE